MIKFAGIKEFLGCSKKIHGAREHIEKKRSKFIVKVELRFDLRSHPPPKALLHVATDSLNSGPPAFKEGFTVYIGTILYEQPTTWILRFQPERCKLKVTLPNLNYW